LTAAYSLLVNFKPPKGEETRQNPRNPDRAVEEEDGMTFVQAGEAIAGADGVTHTHVTCFRCDHKGHYADKCPDSPNATLLQTEAAVAVTLLQASHTETIVATDDANPVSDFTFAQLPSRHELIPLSWVLLDSQSTVSVFKPPQFLSNIRRSNSQLKVHTNGGTQFASLFVLQHHSDVTLCMDIFYVQGHPSFTPYLAKFNSSPLRQYSTGTKQPFSVRSSQSWQCTSPGVTTSPICMPTWNLSASVTMSSH
jgi:hypothetical protein